MEAVLWVLSWSKPVSLLAGFFATLLGIGVVVLGWIMLTFAKYLLGRLGR
jgi:hypothetical protein